MTREERHIAVLNRMLENMDVYDSIQPTQERKKAIKAAIKALSQEPCDDAISRQAVLEIICRETEWYDIRTQIEQLPSVTQKSETVTEFADRCRECGKMRFIDDIKADLIDEANEHMAEGDYDDGVRFGLMLAEQIVCMHLGKVQKSGEWIKKEDDTCWWYVCSECEQEPLKNRWNDDDVLSTYCPNCGAKMVEPQESEDKE